MLFRERAAFPLAHAVRTRDGATLGEVFSFLSGLYFRGKLRYATTFAAPPRQLPGVMVITAGDGLRPPDTRVTLATLESWARVPIDVDEPRYTAPLRRDVDALADLLAPHPECQVVLLGSVASDKYAQLLGARLGARLVFPSDFVGRGDMSRGGLLLRCVEDARELDYVPVAGAVRRGTRPPRLAPKPGILKRDAER
jgi:hypothetical protein